MANEIIKKMGAPLVVTDSVGSVLKLISDIQADKGKTARLEIEAKVYMQKEKQLTIREITKIEAENKENEREHNERIKKLENEEKELEREHRERMEKIENERQESERRHREEMKKLERDEKSLDIIVDKGIMQLIENESDLKIKEKLIEILKERR